MRTLRKLSRGHSGCDCLCDGLVGARHCEVAEFFPGHFLRVAWSGNQPNTLIRHPELFVQVPSGNAVVFHHHALDSIDKDFVADPLRFVFLNGRIQIARGDGKNQYITRIHDRLHVRGGLDAAGVKLNALDVIGVATILEQMVFGFLSAHPPIQFIGIREQQLGDSRGPRTASDQPKTGVGIHAPKVMDSGLRATFAAAFVRT